MDSIPEIVVFSVYRVSRALDPLNSTKENVSHPILWQYDSFPAARHSWHLRDNYHPREETLCLWPAQLLYVVFPDVVCFKCGFLVKVSHLAIGRAAEVASCDASWVTQNTERFTAWTVKDSSGQLWSFYFHFLFFSFLNILKKPFLCLQRLHRENKCCSIGLVPGTGFLQYELETLSRNG